MLKAFVFNRSQVSFIPGRWDLKDGAVVVTVVKAAGSSRIRFVGINNSDIKVLGNAPIPVEIVSSFTSKSFQLFIETKS